MWFSSLIHYEKFQISILQLSSSYISPISCSMLNYYRKIINVYTNFISQFMILDFKEINLHSLCKDLFYPQLVYKEALLHPKTTTFEITTFNLILFSFISLNTHFMYCYFCLFLIFNFLIVCLTFFILMLLFVMISYVASFIFIFFSFKFPFLVFICSLVSTGFLFWTWKPIKKKEEIHHISIKIKMYMKIAIIGFKFNHFLPPSILFYFSLICNHWRSFRIKLHLNLFCCILILSFSALSER